MKIGFFGNPQISADLLAAIFDQKKHQVIYIVTNPDKILQRRGRQIISTPVAKLAIQKCPTTLLLKPTNLQESEFVRKITSIPVDVILVFAYGKLLPDYILDLPSLMAINLHGSLLPALRGASPIQSALLHGFHSTGWTIQKMSSNLDAGDILAQSKVAIGVHDNAQTLTQKMLPQGLQLTLQTLDNLQNQNGKLTQIVQDEKASTYCCKWNHIDAQIPQVLSAWQCHNWIRAHNPWKLSWIFFKDKCLYIVESSWPAVTQALSKRVYMQCSDGLLEITRLRQKDKSTVSGRDFLNSVKGMSRSSSKVNQSQKTQIDDNLLQWLILKP